MRSVAAEIAAASREGVEVAVVVGGGNFFRGINAWDGLERATADYMGMLATCMNAICLQVRLNGMCRYLHCMHLTCCSLRHCYP